MLGSSVPKSRALPGVFLLSAGRNPQGPHKHVLIRTRIIISTSATKPRSYHGKTWGSSHSQLELGSAHQVLSGCFFSVLFMGSKPIREQQHSMQSFWGNDPTSPAVLRNAPQVLQDQGTATEGGQHRAEELAMLRAAACSRLENEACWLVAAFYTKKPQVIYF